MIQKTPIKIALFMLMIIFASAFVVAEDKYQCRVTVDMNEIMDVKGSFSINDVKQGYERCYEQRSLNKICQIYQKNVAESERYDWCYEYCMARSELSTCPTTIVVEKSTNLEAHNRKNPLSNVASEGGFLDKIADWWNSKTEEKNEVIEAEECHESEELVNGECVYKCEMDETWNGKECIPENVDKNTYQKEYLDDGRAIYHFVDVYGNDKWTIDGKHYYDSRASAITHDNPISKGWTSLKETPGNMWDFMFKTKLKDKDKELQRSVAMETLAAFDTKSDAEKQKDNVVGNVTKGLETIVETVLEGNPGKEIVMKSMSVPADSIKEFKKEADRTEFAQGAMIYMKERESGKTPDAIYQNPNEELVFGGFKGVGMNINTKYPKALLFAKYEESYQKYKIAKEIGREE